MKKTRGPGRPKLPARKKRAESVSIRLRADRKRIYIAAAARKSQPLSEWVIDACDAKVCRHHPF